ncbi:MFS transporter [Propionibacterium freudenreichii]|uniref:High-affinity glucose transporter n=5 Tax=Propionibacterium freudenreichii TaxID=1744 RepID=A0A2C7ZHP2_9ACTN|nr:MFS transporter [Propionibacterium freudenreichii]MCT2984454.1 MFS transporter [Propionibacterium freudenreichii]MCT2997035.1 MFS transporter [Propionibacterium freudenreichii]MCT3002812.1 MFS transporter [Propionibacterium freudenreichii]MDK9346989.1 MFS transporter [Propionibacterium freudenreichii]MDK9624653.1 MFS transporter [Propionibacterium freudenreichii]
MTTPGIRQRVVGGLSRDVLVLGLIAFFVAVGFGVLVPVLPTFAASFGATDFLVGMVVSMFAATRLATSPFCGWILDKIGGRLTLAVGIFIVAASSWLMGEAGDFWWLLGWRAAGGIGSAMFTVSAMTLLLASVPPDMRGRATGFYQSGFLIGGMAGPALGGLLTRISLVAPFRFYAITLAIAGLIGLTMLSSATTHADRPAHARATPRPLRQVLADTRFQAACVANFAQGWNSMGVRNSLIPLVIVATLGLTPTWTGIVFAVSAVVQVIVLHPIGHFVDTVGRRPALLAGGVVMAASIAAVPLSGSIWIVMALMCVYAVGAAAMSTAPAASVGDATGGVHGGTPVAIFSMSSDVGAIIGPLAAGAISDVAGRPLAFAVGAVFLALSSLVALRMPGGRPDHCAGSVASADPDALLSED